MDWPRTDYTCAYYHAQYLWPESSAPQYTLPLAASAAMCVVCVALIWTIRALLVKENKRIRREDENARLFYAY